jgi:hypothetical protein
MLELENEEFNHFVITEGDDDGWSASLPGSSLILRFNEARVAGNDVYLIKKEEDEEGKEHIFAVLDADMWKICGEDD